MKNNSRLMMSEASNVIILRVCWLNDAVGTSVDVKVG